MTGESENRQEEILRSLREQLPEVFSEGKIDIKQLRAALGEEVLTDTERYGLNWAGKMDCFRTIQETTTHTLKPVRDESVDFDNTENLFIEGDNLEVLKVLQKSYYGKVKMIYIDPPYNTGNDFIYNDKFSRNKREYLEEVGAIDKEGNVVNAGLYTQNTRDSGHFHSDWLNMMYPRLFLAKNLLRQDGVIFVSIDDNEVNNLRTVMNEIFGEENFISQFVWVKKKKGSHLSKTVRSMTEYVLAFSKSLSSIELYGEAAYSDKWQPLAKRTNGQKVLSFPADKIKTSLPDGSYHSGQYKEGTSSLKFIDDFVVANGLIINSLQIEGPFVWGQAMLDNEILQGTEIALSKEYGLNVLRFDQADRIKRPSTLIDKGVNVGTNEDAYQELLQIFQVEGILDYPKPVSLIKYLIKTVSYSEKDAIILDFFAGSGTTADAVMQLNIEDGGNRKYVCVQLSEKCRPETAAAKAGFMTIADLAKERIRRSGKKVSEQNFDQKIDIGFKVFKLDESNFKIWNTHVTSVEQLEQQMIEMFDNVQPGATKEAMMYELILKSGNELNVAIEEKEAGGEKYFRVNDGSLVICLADKLSKELFTGILVEKPKKIIVLDKSFGNNDQLKTNLLLQAEGAGVDEVRVI